MKNLKEALKYVIFLLCFVVNPCRPNHIGVTMISKAGTSGPGRFIRNLTIGLEGLDGEDSKIRRNPLLGFKALLVISSMPVYMYAATKFFRIRTILRVDGFSYPDLYDNSCYRGKNLRNFRELSLRRIKTNYEIQVGLKLADYVVYQSEFSKRMSDKWLFKRNEKYEVIPNGVDTELFRPRSRKYPDKNIVSIHGNLRDEDIFRCALEVFNGLGKEYLGKVNELRIIGSMSVEVRAALESFLAECQECRDRIMSFGLLNESELADILPESDVSIHLTAADACPNAVLESMASGVPVVCQSFGGQSDLVGNGGVVISGNESYDYSDTLISKGIAALSRALETRSELSVSARNRAEELFSIEQMSRSYLEVFNRI